MQILADENIPMLEVFERHGQLHRVAGRSLNPEMLKDVEVLLVRSVTQVDKTLLANSKVKFVGTCTIGTDHLDLEYLAERKVGWFSAPGCNARGVVDYVISGLLTLAERTGADLTQRCYGVVGAGQVGDRLVQVLRGLGWQVLVCDPPREQREGGDYVDLKSIIENCDVISLHTPLTTVGEHSTRHLIGEEQLAALRPGSWLINASRGAVVDNQALKTALKERSDLRAILDVWEGEPQVDVELAQLCDIATAHIAGYSLDGKIRGTEQIYQAFCQYFGLKPEAGIEFPPQRLLSLQLAEHIPLMEALRVVCRAVYDSRGDDARFRLSLSGDAVERRAAFDLVRKNYPVRREIPDLKVTVEGSELQQMLGALGIKA
ncbi:4-phosphoerythronate dehydrogenase PdxB [Denitrificimonas sp. JX-1]|uniref:Erythronate-4-phosphate dehydrogenase n=1 Tax=Denitrificimonas halotolerans TaxID=3098930 RepID=A0ABU5GPR5_9GAMM|nr:4-phosphoerythronate dehydrogenase PdxB [Denitrificimonas sp. JX-1]MDY7218992.1 4-phosphoerythronate dehydrogenase PdxB [Denitrificimonas sp. JX-1]